MDNLDEGLIKLVNHKDHPTNKAYRVFFFYKKHEAEHFKKLLLKENIHFEYASVNGLGSIQLTSCKTGYL